MKKCLIYLRVFAFLTHIYVYLYLTSSSKSFIGHGTADDMFPYIITSCNCYFLSVFDMIRCNLFFPISRRMPCLVEINISCLLFYLIRSSV